MWEFKSLHPHHNRGIRTPRLRNRIFGFFFFCAVFVLAAAPVGVIGENQIQKQFVFLPAFEIEKHFHFVVVQHNAINVCVNQCLAVFRFIAVIYDFNNWQIDWNSTNTTVQQQAVVEDLEIFDTFDKFYAKNKHTYSGIKKFMYEYIGRKIMTNKVSKVRRYGKNNKN